MAVQHGQGEALAYYLKQGAQRSNKNEMDSAWISLLLDLLCLFISFCSADWVDLRSVRSEYHISELLRASKHDADLFQRNCSVEPNLIHRLRIPNFQGGLVLSRVMDQCHPRSNFTSLFGHFWHDLGLDQTVLLAKQSTDDLGDCSTSR